MIKISFEGTVTEIKRDIAQFFGLDMNAIRETTTQVNPDIAMVVQAPKEEKKPAKPKVKKEETPPPVAKFDPTATPPTAVEKVAIPSEKDVQDAVVAVNEKFSIDKAIECLTKFQVKRARELREDQRAAFIAHCAGILA